MTHNLASSPITPKRASKMGYRYSIAHFDFHPNSLPPSRIPVPVRRWTGNWHTVPLIDDLCCCCDSPTIHCTCSRHDDDETTPICPIPVSAPKPHVKSAFPEFEAREEAAEVSSRARTPVIEYENVRYSSPISSSTHSVGLESDDDVWSTIAIASVKELEEMAETGKEKEHLKRRLTIEKIQEHGSIAKKQRKRKQNSSGDEVPSKTKRFFDSIKHLFRSVSTKSSPLANINVNESYFELGEMENSLETAGVVGDSAGISTILAGEKTELTTPCPSPLTTIEEIETAEEDKDNFMPFLTFPDLPAAKSPSIISDLRQNNDFVVKRSIPHDSSHDMRTAIWKSTLESSPTISRKP